MRFTYKPFPVCTQYKCVRSVTINYPNSNPDKIKEAREIANKLIRGFEGDSVPIMVPDYMTLTYHYNHGYLTVLIEFKEEQ